MDRGVPREPAIDRTHTPPRAAAPHHLVVFVASAPGFTEQPRVANGASDVLVDVFGDTGRHARAAVATPELPLGAPVEVELIAEIY